MPSEVRTSYGLVRGVPRDDHHAFLGIPYAAPPVGKLRFAAPVKPAAWQGTRDAVAYAPSAPQPNRPGFSAQGPQSEDCLYLNVFTPAADARRRPVLFWIHGGGFITGSGSEAIYNGGPLAVRGDVVVVTINYRLGALGYLYLGAHTSAAFGATSNLGQLDQIAALRWVRENIAAFGGDPSNVTIFGESAGSVAVCTLLAMPAARGLFVRAIAQSGTANRLGNQDTATSTAASYLTALGLSDGEADRIRDVPVDALLAAQGTLAGSGLGVFGPIVDPHSLPERPLEVVRAGGAANIPLLIGSNRDETKLYVDPKRKPLDDAELSARVRAILPHRARERVSEVLDLYRASRKQRGLPHANNDLLDALETAATFAIPTVRLAEAHAAHQPKTFAYLFDWESPARRNTLGACHALELAFVFGTLGAPGTALFNGSGPAADKLSSEMMEAWLAFAKSGDPSCAAIGHWPRYDARERNTMLFGQHTRAHAAPFEEERALWATLL